MVDRSADPGLEAAYGRALAGPPYRDGSLEGEAYGLVMAQLGYDAAEASPLRQSYHRAVGSGDYELAGDREDVVTFSRVLRQKSSLYKSFARVIERRVVGADGLLPEPQNGNAASEAAAANFRRWAESKLCDAQRRRTWPALLRAAVHEAVVGGDCLGNRIERPGMAPPFDAAVQLIESERIASPARGVITSEMRNGVEVDDLGAPVAYHIVAWSETGSSLVHGDTVRLYADKADLLGLDYERVGQTRGMPLISQGLTRIADVDEVHEAVTTAIKLTAIFVLVLKSMSPQGADRWLSQSVNRSAGPGGEAGANVRNVLGQRPGTILNAPKDAQLETVKHGNPPAGFDVWNRIAAGIIAAGAGIPREVAFGDFGSLNFSQARMVNMYAEETLGVLRNDVVGCFAEPMYRWITARAVRDGTVPRDPSRADGIPAAGSWTRPPEVEYDRLAGIKASREAIDSNLSTHAREVRKRGLDPEAVLRDRADEMARMIEDGTLPPTTPGAQIIAQGLIDTSEDRA